MMTSSGLFLSKSGVNWPHGLLTIDTGKIIGCSRYTMDQDANEEEKVEVDETDRPETRPYWQIYVSRALSNWGDRLWVFGIGIFMNKLMPSSLILVAILGFAQGLSVIILGPAIGGWVDRTKRLTASVTFLFIQNFMVVINCVILALHFYWGLDQVFIDNAQHIYDQIIKIDLR